MVRKYLATYHIGHLVEEQREVWVLVCTSLYYKLCMQLACDVHVTGYCHIVVCILSLQLAAIDKDFLKFRSDMEAKVSH